MNYLYTARTKHRKQDRYATRTKIQDKIIQCRASCATPEGEPRGILLIKPKNPFTI
jgi:hypothetical protein